MVHARQLALVLVVASTACAGQARLVAADGSHRMIARDATSGITVVLTTHSWPGDSIYDEDLTIADGTLGMITTPPTLISPRLIAVTLGGQSMLTASVVSFGTIRANRPARH